MGLGQGSYGPGDPNPAERPLEQHLSEAEVPSHLSGIRQGQAPAPFPQWDGSHQRVSELGVCGEREAWSQPGFEIRASAPS